MFFAYQKINKKYGMCRTIMENNLQVTIFLITLINAFKLNQIVSQNRRTDDGTPHIPPQIVLGFSQHFLPLLFFKKIVLEVPFVILRGI